ncbi:MAG: histidine phosphatase family protein, partial [Bacilli bacterium]
LSNIPLDEDGVNDAHSLAERLSKENWEVIYSSDLLRAKQTAEIINLKLGIESIYFDEKLREMRGGKIEGTTEEERIHNWGQNWREIELGLESPVEGMLRGTQIIEEIAKQHANKNVLIVSHGALIGNSLKKLIPLFNTEEHLKNTSITKLKKINNIWECEVYNCTIHLG